MKNYLFSIVSSAVLLSPSFSYAGEKDIGQFAPKRITGKRISIDPEIDKLIAEGEEALRRRQQMQQQNLMRRVPEELRGRLSEESQHRLTRIIFDSLSTNEDRTLFFMGFLKVIGLRHLNEPLTFGRNILGLFKRNMRLHDYMNDLRTLYHTPPSQCENLASLAYCLTNGLNHKQSKGVVAALSQVPEILRTTKFIQKVRKLHRIFDTVELRYSPEGNLVLSIKELSKLDIDALDLYVSQVKRLFLCLGFYDKKRIEGERPEDDFALFNALPSDQREHTLDQLQRSIDPDIDIETREILFHGLTSFKSREEREQVMTILSNHSLRSEQKSVVLNCITQIPSELRTTPLIRDICSIGNFDVNDLSRVVDRLVSSPQEEYSYVLAEETFNAAIFRASDLLEDAMRKK